MTTSRQVAISIQKKTKRLELEKLVQEQEAHTSVADELEKGKGRGDERPSRASPGGDEKDSSNFMNGPGIKPAGHGWRPSDPQYTNTHFTNAGQPAFGPMTAGEVGASATPAVPPGPMDEKVLDETSTAPPDDHLADPPGKGGAAGDEDRYVEFDWETLSKAPRVGPGKNREPTKK